MLNFKSLSVKVYLNQIELLYLRLLNDFFL